MNKLRWEFAGITIAAACAFGCSSSDGSVDGEQGFKDPGGTGFGDAPSGGTTTPGLPTSSSGEPTTTSGGTTPGTTEPAPGDPAAPPDPTAAPPEPTLEGCGLSTGFAGDEYCILPPPVDQGFQIHYGPLDYDNPDDVAQYLLAPGEETNIYVPATSGNTVDVFFYKRQYRMRPGSHHLIVSEAGGSGFGIGMGRRLGGSQNVAKDNPSGEIPPENVGIGIPLQANAPLSLNLHHFNGSAEPILREAWINFWYVDPATVTQQANEMFLWANGPSVLPGDTAVAAGSQFIDQEGRVLTMYGHRHSNSVRFTAYRVRGGNRQLVYEDYDWLEPSVLEYNSLTQNSPPNPELLQAGGHSGILDLLPGDALEWECEIINQHAEIITFGQNEAITSEMCILIGDAVGPTLLGFSL